VSRTDVLTLSYDLRAPDFGAPQAELYRAALDQAEWADRVGFDAVQVMEHHGTDDGYLPSPLVFAAAIAARTRRVRIWVSALVLPLHDPVMAAEELAVLDLVSGGRITVVVAAGYRRSEFEMFGVDFERRAWLADEGIEVMTRAWAGEPFSYQGRDVQVTPRPLQRPRIPIVLGGGSKGSAKRAARIADGYRPSKPELVQVYLDELSRLGKGDPLVAPSLAGHPTTFVSRDVEATWRAIEAHAAHDTNSYVEWTKEQPGVYRQRSIVSPAGVRTGGGYLVLTPDQAVERVRSGAGLHLKPLLGGLDPEVSWQSLRVIEDDVLPRLERTLSARADRRA
jgi:alkanesulfonate monooxygenase SsuD/methylene tetrahydromethanopterin reductase-like flavin-dependent oxidoreductase (luciferase family)